MDEKKNDGVFNGRLSLLIVLIPIAVITMFALAYKGLSSEIEESLLHEKFVEKQQSVELLAAQIDAYVQTPAYKNGFGRFELILSSGLAQVDAQPFTFAALYDEHLDNVSARTPSYSSAFEPLTDEDFSAVVRKNNAGEFVMPYTPDEDVTRDMYIYYRWIPTSTEHDGRYLAVVAVSKYSIQSMLPAGVWALPMALCIVTTIIVTTAAWLLCYLGYVYLSRGGDDKRREAL